MNTRLLRILSLTCLLLTILWLVFLIVGLTAAGEMDTFEKVLAYVGKLDIVFYLTYMNAALITVNGVPRRPSREQLEELAKTGAMVIVHPTK